MKCQIQFPEKKNRKLFKKCHLLKIDGLHSDIFSRQHIDDTFIFSNKHLTFGDNLHEMSNSVFQEKYENVSICLLKQKSTYNILKYFFLFFPENKNLFWGENINLSSPAKLAQIVKKVEVH